MRPACIPGPLRQVGGMMRTPPARRKSSCISANKKLTFTRANVWLAKPLSPQASPAFRPRQGTIRLPRRTLVMSRPSLAITWTITETWLNRTSIHERIPARTGPILMAPGCHMPCSSEAVMQCIRGTFHPLPRRTVASAYRVRWR